MRLANEANWDRLIRMVVAVVALGLGWSGLPSPDWATGLQLFGLYPLVTGILGWDPLYSLLRVSTLRD